MGKVKIIGRKFTQKDIVNTVLFYGNNFSSNPRQNYFIALRIRCVIRLILPEPTTGIYFNPFYARRKAKDRHVNSLLGYIKDLNRWQDIMDVKESKMAANKQLGLLKNIRIVAIKITGDFRMSSQESV